MYDRILNIVFYGFVINISKDVGRGFSFLKKFNFYLPRLYNFIRNITQNGRLECLFSCVKLFRLTVSSRFN